MNKPTLAVGVALMLMATAMLATAYHIPMTPGTPFPGDADDWINPGTGNVIVACEDPGLGLPGIGGLCWASSQHIDNATKIKEKKDTAQDQWGAVEPKCIGSLEDEATGLPLNPFACVPGHPLGLPEPLNLEDKSNENVTGDWFARIGSNARACNGEWGQTFVYKEMIAYYGGVLPDEKGVSGHVTFFINEPDNYGTYNYNKYSSDPSDSKTIGNCTGNDVGLCDDSIKTDPNELCGAAKKE